MTNDISAQDPPQAAPHPPSAYNVIRYDYGALLCFLAPLVAWGMVLAASMGFSFDAHRDQNDGWSDTRFYLLLALGASLVCLPILILRVRALRFLFFHGQRVQGLITDVRFVSGRGRINYTYTFNGQDYVGGSPSIRSERTNQYQKDQQIMLLVDPRNPARATIERLFG
jgi:hypothetical protein